MADQQTDVMERLRDVLSDLFNRESEPDNIDAYLDEHGLGDVTTHDIDACLPSDYKSWLASSGAGSAASSSAAASSASSAAAASASSSSSAVAQYIHEHYNDYRTYIEDRSVDYGSGNTFDGQFQTSTGDVGGNQNWNQTQEETEDKYGEGDKEQPDPRKMGEREPGGKVEKGEDLPGDGEEHEDKPDDEPDQGHVPDPLGAAAEDRSVDYGSDNTFDGQFQTNTGDVAGNQNWNQTQTTIEPEPEPEPEPKPDPYVE